LLVGGGVDDPTSTVYKDISRIPPAHVVAITPGHVHRERYWRVEETPDAGSDSPTERAELLRGTLRKAIRGRVSGARHVGSMLSGGLDSGAVTALAAEYLGGQGRRLTAFTSVPAFATPSLRNDAALVNEGPSAADVARSYDSIDHVLVPARTVSPLAGIRRAMTIVGEPSIASANQGWITEIMADAQARGVDVLLTGQVGDFVMAGRPAKPGWQLRRLAPDWLRRLRRADWKPWRLAESPWRSSSVIHPDFAREVRLAELVHDQRASHGMSVLDPLQDKRVMELMFSAPRPAVSGTSDRWLFRQSLAGVLPEHVRLSRTKGLQSADIVERLVASWTEVEEALALAEASPLARRCLDLRYCRVLAESLRAPKLPHDARRRAFTLVNGIAVALFLVETWERAD
jgi:asparagine synthase (glutamine-hydrolysing)